MAVRVKVNRTAVRTLLRSSEMRAELERRARRIAAAADANAGTPGGHRVDSDIGKNRARAAVITATPKAMHQEATKRSLTRAIDAGRG